MPCEHIYRLFYELADSNNRKIPEIIDIPYNLADMFSTLDSHTQLYFISSARYMLNKGRTVSLSDDVKAVIDSGLYLQSDNVDFSILLNKMTKDEIILALAKKSISGYAPSWSKVKLIAWIIENHTDFLKSHFKQFVYIEIAPQASEWISGVIKSIDSYSHIMPNN